MMKALSFVTIVILLGAVLLGFDLSQTELRAAEARQMDVETEFDQQLQQIELDRIQEETNINLETLRARRAKELEIFEQEARRRNDLYEFAVLLGLAVVAVAVLVPSVALAYYLIRRGNAVRASQPVVTEKPGLRLLEFPSTRSGHGPSTRSGHGPTPDKRKRKRAQVASYGWPDEAA